ncbi:MAG: hypothetical protein E7063_03055 [Spirochaetaceae bacterium]|nr:hypothetical protein [Spirochaetaceae bacterium]
MSLKSIFNLALTNDGKRYNAGDISEKTGLQKQPDGSWKPPKGSNAGKHQKSQGRANTEYNILNQHPYADEKDLEDFYNEEMKGFKTEKEYDFNPEQVQRRFDQWYARNRHSKHYGETMEKGKRKPFEGKTTNAVHTKENQNKTPKAKFDEYGLPNNKTITMKEEFLKKENVTDPSKLTNAEFNALAKKLDSELGIGNMELAQELLVTPAENPYALSKEEKNEAMKNPKTRLSQKYDEVIKSKKGTPQYNTALEEYTKEREFYKNSEGVEALKGFPVVPTSKDSACSRLTADTKIRLKKKLTIDRVYQIGEKSEKTGKIKVANGKWVDPKKVKNTTKEADNKSMVNTEKQDEILTVEERIEKAKQLLTGFNEKKRNIEKNAESMIFELGELNSLASKGYGPKNNLSFDIYREKNEIIPKLAESLNKKGWAVKIGDDYLSWDNNTKNVIYFEKDGVQVSFHRNFKNLDYPKASENEWNGLYNAYKYKTKEAQQEALKQQNILAANNENRLEKIQKEFKKFLTKEADRLSQKDIITQKEKDRMLKYGKIYISTENYNPTNIKK